MFSESDSDSDDVVPSGDNKRRKCSIRLQPNTLDEIEVPSKNASTADSTSDQNLSSAVSEFLTGKSEPGVSRKSKNPATDSSYVWSIDDTLFYPLGMRSLSVESINRLVVVVWSECSVINFVIKANTDAKNTTKVRFDLSSDGEKVKDIIMLERNTLVLLDSGVVKYFVSVKTIRSVSWLDNVRVLTTAPQGFSLIRLTTDRKLVLEVYEDVEHLGKRSKGPLKHQYDITFDEQNLFNCAWEDEHFVLLSMPIDEENVDFLENLTRQSLSLANKRELHIFVVSGNVFALVADTDDDDNFQIEMLFSYASNVMLIKVDYRREFCLVFLQCGTIDIWYMSTTRKRLCHQVHNTGVDYTNYSYSDKHATFFYTDETQIAQLKFSYIEDSDEFVVLENYKVIPGILACTWAETTEKLICLSCNNIFYELEFDPIAPESKQQARKSNTTVPSTTVSDYENLNTLYELREAHLEKLQELIQMPEMYYQLIEKEFVKQQLIAIADKKHFYESFLTARLEYSRGSFFIPVDSIPLYTKNQMQLDSHSIIALIHIEISRNEIFDCSLWTLNLYFDTETHIFPIPSNKELNSKFCLVIPLRKPHRSELPKFELTLYTFIENSTDCLAVPLHISITEDFHSYEKLFSNHCNYHEGISSYCSLKDLFKRFNKDNSIPKSINLQYLLKFPKNLDLLKAFDNFRACKREPKESADGEQSFFLYFFNSMVEINLNKSNSLLQIRSTDALALYYLKIYLRLFFKDDPQEYDSPLVDDNREMKLRYQSNIERLYGTLSVDSTNENLSGKFSKEEKLEKLRTFHQKLRKEEMKIMIY